jgi:hypothetical protein
MEAETLAGLMGLAGALVGAALSSGAVIWQQQKATHTAERTYRLGLSEGAATEIIRLSFELEDILESGDPTEESWKDDLRQKCRAVEEQSLRFTDENVRAFMGPANAELFVLSVRRDLPNYWDASHLLIDIRHAMGFVLRREPLPKEFQRAHIERHLRPRSAPS